VTASRWPSEASSHHREGLIGQKPLLQGTNRVATKHLLSLKGALGWEGRLREKYPRKKEVEKASDTKRGSKGWRGLLQKKGDADQHPGERDEGAGRMSCAEGGFCSNLGHGVLNMGRLSGGGFTAVGPLTLGSRQSKEFPVECAEGEGVREGAGLDLLERRTGVRRENPGPTKEGGEKVERCTQGGRREVLRRVLRSYLSCNTGQGVSRAGGESRQRWGGEKITRN